MPRSARLELAGGIHHVTARGNRGQAIFGQDRDRQRFLRVFVPGWEESRYAEVADPRPPLEELVRREPHTESMRAAREHGYRLAEIATAFGVSRSTVSRRTR